jgi:hypothetical protein
MTQSKDTNSATQPESVDHSERVLQLLCLIAQSLRRIESRLDNIAGVTPQRQGNKIVAFNTEGRR